eukprot:3577192-Prymnesium_polylepis.1
MVLGSPTSSSTKYESAEQLAHHVLERARGLYNLERYADAAIAFQQCLALTEERSPASLVNYLEWRGAVVHNLASCYHNLSYFDVAQIYYELAARDFEHCVAQTSGLALAGPLLSDSNINKRRLGFVRQRLDDVNCGRPPDKETYLDSGGNRRAV